MKTSIIRIFSTKKRHRVARLRAATLLGLYFPEIRVQCKKDCDIKWRKTRWVIQKQETALLRAFCTMLNSLETLQQASNGNN